MRWRSAGRTIILALMAVLLLLGCNRGSAEKSRLRISAATALFAQFETVFYAKTDLLVTTDSYKGLPQESANVLRLPFADLLGGLESLGPRASNELLGNADAVLVGAKDFRPPAALGDVQSRLCYVVVLGRNSRPILAKTMAKFPSATEGEGSVWRWLVKPTEGNPAATQFYATEMANSYLLISNSLDELRLMTQRLASSTGGSPSRDDVREWETISQHEIWGYRHYRQNEATNKEAAGISEVMPGAEGLAFFVDLKQSVGVLWLFSSIASTSRQMNVKHLTPALNEVKSGLWETKVSLSGSATLQPMINVMGLFGFAIYL